jgi:superfamily II DNA or RNA helicase
MPIELKPHQKFVVDYFKKHNPRGILLFHGLGTGKTITSLSIANLYPTQKVVVILPVSTMKAFNDDINKMKLDKSRFTLISYESSGKLLSEDFYLKDKILICDEAHRLRNIDGVHISQLMNNINQAFKVILLSGTPIVNNPSDLAPLFNAIAGTNVLPLNTEKFIFDYVKEETMKETDEYNRVQITIQYMPQNMFDFKSRIHKMVSFHIPMNMTDYPTFEIHKRKVEMNKEQVTEYRKVIDKHLKTEDRYILDYAGDYQLLQTLTSGTRINSFLSNTRQISNTVNGYDKSPKLLSILNELQKGKLPAIIYSNFKTNGVFPMATLLSKNGISHELYTGELNTRQRDRIVNDYNNRKFDVLLMTSSASEGLDLKNTRQIHIMDLHWNMTKTKQVIGRGVRYKSHIELKESERHVDVYFWMSTFSDQDKKTLGRLSADEYLYEVASKKEKLAKEFYKLLSESAIEQL